LGVTTVYVTHDQEEAMVLSDRVAIMDKGKVQQIGTPEHVYNRPANRFVAQFLGAANLLAAKVIASNENGGSGRALLAGVDVPFTAGRPIPQGAMIELFLRPESVQLGREDAAPLRGVVETAMFVGESTKFRVRIDADTVISVTSPNRTGSSEYTTGERVSVSWDVDRAVALADGSG
jgi:ABC-type Fe3+/spermidine/putrescine transport system ATPase subunit